MRIVAIGLLLAASCATPPETGGLPDLGEPDEALTETEKLLSPKMAGVRTEGAARRALSRLRHHWTAARESAELDLLLAEAHARFVDGLDLKREEDRPRHQRHRNAGLFHAREALRLDPDVSPGHYWLGVLLLHAADGEQSYGRLKEALFELNAAEALAPGIDDGGPSRMKGRIYQETPGFPFLGSQAKAIECYRKSLEIAPGCLRTRLWLAETYVADKQPEKGRPLLQEILDAAGPVDRPVENADLKRQAQDLLQKIA